MKNYRINSLGSMIEIKKTVPFTAYELADELENWTDNAEAAVMLRKQADTIADLETTIKFLQEECAALRSQLNEISN